ncbi:MAG: hypothetical protein QOJ26_1744 [Thermoplasmata archaeon]|jgi:hypothetical protein|nr:hypothetical protein [Thermoplasmata archaeon]MEA3166870.1 hypothetical protein [Thermoplasmata archaeon]
MPRSPSDAPAAPRLLRRDDGVSEVIGFLLIFGIISMIMLLSMGAFVIAHQGATQRAVEVRAESVAARVAGVIVQTALVAEAQDGRDPALANRIDLPQQLEGLSYTVALEPQVPGVSPDRVRVDVPSLAITVHSPVFASSAGGASLCSVTTVAGGPLFIRINEAPGHPVVSGCAGKIFLEEA